MWAEATVTVRFLILYNDILPFLRWLYTRHEGLEARPYAKQLRTRHESLYFRADFYSTNLRALGHEAWEVYSDNAAMQEAWARENGLPSGESAPPGPSTRRALQYTAPLFKANERQVAVSQAPPRLYEILAAQIEQLKPDVVLNQDLYLNPRFFAAMKSHTRLLVGQHWSMPLADRDDYRCYDVILSSFAPTLEYFRRRGIPAELLRLGFEPRVLAALPPVERTLHVSFVGNVFDAGIHHHRVTFLEQLCRLLPDMGLWGYAVRTLAADSAIRRCYRGLAWGREMYGVLSRSRITINHHGIQLPFANNMRLYEATGMGSLLITDWKDNLPRSVSADSASAR